ncbi:MAG: solute carrier family 23 protein [Planctomycetota bacterium]|jgi:xanthine/uracil permease|nr:solute carrier family 23 protein [Planctomycetota bacterium]
MSTTNSDSGLLYGLHDRPPFFRALVLGLQHVLTMFGATIAVPLLLGPYMGMSPDQIGDLISSVMICSGVATLLQVTIGSRLPIIQGVSFSFLAAFFFIIFSVKDMPGVTDVNQGAVTMQYIAGAVLLGAAFEIFIGFSGLMGKLRRYLTPVVIGPVIMLIGLALYPFGAPKAGQDWAISGLVIVLILFFSLVLGARSRFIQMFPILLAILIGYGVCWSLSQQGVYRPRMTLLPRDVIEKQGFSLDNDNAQVKDAQGNPLCTFNSFPDYLVVAHPPTDSDMNVARNKALSASAKRLPDSESHPGQALYVLESKYVDRLGWVAVNEKNFGNWIAVRTRELPRGLQGGISVGDISHVDLTGIEEKRLFKDPAKIFFPWGWPKFNLAFFFAVLAGYLASMIESFGDYHACSQMAGGGDPTPEQISRGIGAEGLGCAVTGVLGGFSSTSYSENVGLIGLTKVGSRFVVLVGSFFLLALGLVSRVGAAVATIPDPIVGALYCALFGLISAIGIQQLAKADLHKDRTLLIAGFSLFMGLSVPVFFKNLSTGALTESANRFLGTLHIWIPHSQVATATGEVFIAIASSGMAVAAIIGLILDNTIPGKMEITEEP